ncbi:hypothetical protein [Halomicrobium salinisoli]|uniref:hypothetical protein n=1 Tax=Halomicrobium salinisoli TaxID=2878391 RepID=UPI001CF05754|nr:hypothetical protein [Halomicrobium salinisoli]
MVSAPRTQRAWLIFVGSVVALYAALLVAFTNDGVLQSVLLGAFYGLTMSVAVALLVVVWRGVPDLLYPDDVEDD